MNCPSGDQVGVSPSPMGVRTPSLSRTTSIVGLAPSLIPIAIRSPVGDQLAGFALEPRSWTPLSSTSGLAPSGSVTISDAVLASTALPASECVPSPGSTDQKASLVPSDDQDGIQSR